MIATAFQPHRDRLVALAYRMLGSVAGAEDVVQETWVRWSEAPDVANPRAWLVTVCTRLCLDELRSARARREQHTGPWLPEPWVDEAPPPPGVLAESLSMAFLLLLEVLSPRERAAFLLREVFEEDYDAIAAVLDTSPANVRQLVRRAKAAIDADRPRFDADPEAHQALLAAFGAALQSGDRGALEALLCADVVATSDGGGRAPAATRLLHGPERVSKFVHGVFRKAPPERFSARPCWVNGQPGLVAVYDGAVFSVIAMSVVQGRIARWDTVLDPLKLGHVRA
ncbi:MAG: RNA polymerase sigma factor SigJ [Myxococcota bacterium]